MRVDAYLPEYDQLVQKFCETGATMAEVADFFGISTFELYRWMRDHPSFCASLRTGGEIADMRVERAMYERALGSVVRDVKILATGEKIEYDRIIDPDFAAQKHWLSCRQKDKWREKVVHGHEGPDGGPIDIVTRIAITGVEPSGG